MIYALRWGPAIAGEVYQVSLEVAAEIGASIIPDEDEEKIVEALHELPNSPLREDPNPGKIRLDVRRMNAIQLENMGISARTSCDRTLLYLPNSRTFLFLPP